MTTLSDIRDLEARLHSHFLEWSDTPLQNELLFLLDELQVIHGDLDRREVPQTGTDGLQLSLSQRIDLLMSIRQTAKEHSRDFYGMSVEGGGRQLALMDAFVCRFELRMRLAGDERPWERIPPTRYTCRSGTEADNFAQVLADNTPSCVEIRWNWRGFPQGYTVKPREGLTKGGKP